MLILYTLASKSGKSTRCGQCEACYLREDCGRCEICKDMAKFGGPQHFKQRCKKRQCQNFVSSYLIIIIIVGILLRYIL